MRQLNSIALRLSPLRTTDELRSSVLWVRDEFGYDAIAIYHHDPATGGLRLVAGGEDLDTATCLRLLVDATTAPGKALMTEKTVMIANAAAEADPDSRLALRNAGSEMAVPMRIGMQMVGVLDIASTETGAFDDIDRETAEALAQLAAIVIQNAQLHGDLQNEVEDVTVLVAIGRIINSSLEIDDVYEPFALNVARVIPFDWLHLTEVDTDLDRARHMFMVGQEFAGRGRGEWWPLGGTFTEYVIGHRTGVTVSGESPERLKELYPLLAPVIDGGAKSFLSVPLIARDEVIGALQMGTNEGSAYSPRHMALAERVGNQIARAVENARLFRENRDLGVLDERNRVAREIHDTLAQGFTGIVLQLEAAEQALQEAPEEVSEHLDRAKTLARGSLQEARRSVWDMVPETLEQRSLDNALADAVREFAETGPEETTFTVEGEVRFLQTSVETALLRICQESLTNLRRHAGASVASVKLSFESGRVKLTVKDDGRGFDTAVARGRDDGGGFGFIGMEQRARLLQGNLLVTSGQGDGTTIEVTMPTG